MKKLKEKLVTIWNQQLSIPQKYPFVMYEEEKNLLKKYLQPTKKYLEFGLGGSTIFALIESRVDVISIDTNIGWIDFIKKYKIIRNNLNNRLEINYVDIGPTKSWGFPVNDESKNKFPDFSSKIFEKVNLNETDLVLVDARFRVACVLQTILNGRTNPNLKILVHDYSIREDYKVIEEFLDIVESTRTLYVFSIKNDVDLEKVEALYEKYKYNPD